MMRALLAIALLSTASGICPAQSVNGPGDDVLCTGYEPPHLISASDTRTPSAPRPIQPPPINATTGKPLSYRHVTQELQLLSDGTTICWAPAVSVYYRDSAGRTRVEDSFGIEGADGKAAPLVVKILDPVAQVLYTLDMFTRTAYRLVPMKPLPFLPIDRSLPNPAISTTTESLGKHSFEGIDVEGQRTTTNVTGPGTPWSATNEVWTSRDPNLTVLRKSVNPGISTTDAYLNISTAEPDPALFEIPAHYKVVDEKGPVTITVTHP